LRRANASMTERQAGCNLIEPDETGQGNPDRFVIGGRSRVLRLP
jgi:hypothetical protein